MSLDQNDDVKIKGIGAMALVMDDNILNLVSERVRICGTTLNLSNITLKVVPSQILNKCRTIRALYLNSCHMIMPPVEIEMFTNLEELSLDDNELTMIPSGLGSLQELKCLCICENPMGFIPSQIKQLKQLTRLFIQRSQLMYFPEEICDLEMLEFLGLAGNNISTLPDRITSMKKLKWLNLSQNNLKKLPDTMKEFKNLIYIDVSDNGFDEIPCDLLLIPCLMSLIIQGNKISVVSEEFCKHIKRMAKLDLRRNTIEDMPVDLMTCEHVFI